MRVAAALMVSNAVPQTAVLLSLPPVPALRGPRAVSLALPEGLSHVDAFVLYQFFWLLNHLEINNEATGERERVKSHLVSSP